MNGFGILRAGYGPSMTNRPASMHASAIIAVSDLDQARAFYEGKLGLDGSQTPGGGWAVSADDGTLLSLLPGDAGAGTASWPVATFRVDDVPAVVRELTSRGVPFLGPDDIPFELDDDRVSTDDSGLQVAWMRDPDGNIITVFSPGDGGDSTS